MKILVIGGTYFLGKAFLETCLEKGREALLVNRGNRKLEGLPEDRIKTFLMDRHDGEKLKELSDELKDQKIDAVVDFCAYEKGDVKSIIDILPESVQQYLFVSTCDVYRRGTGKVLDEGAELEERLFAGQEGAYINGKVILEDELQKACMQKGLHFTSIRPVIIYGPGNYAPRESIFFHWITQAGQILFPEDADGTFQMVYVKDVAKVIDAVLLREDCFDRAINVCGEAIITYQGFSDALEKACERDIERVSLSVDEVIERGIPLPFPLLAEESEQYAGEFVKKLGIQYTDLCQGLKETFKEFA